MVSLSLYYKVADTPFHIQGNEIHVVENKLTHSLILFTDLSVIMSRFISSAVK